MKKMNFIANILCSVGNFAASFSTHGCWVLVIDEPTMPECLIGK